MVTDESTHGRRQRAQQSAPDSADARTVRVGRHRAADLRLESPRVSASHAEVILLGHAGWVRDLGSRYGTAVNQRPVAGWTPFGPDDRLSVAGSELRLRADGDLQASGRDAGALVCAAGLHVRASRKGKVLLNNLSFVVEPGEFVGLMGLSGAGKSTLLKTLVGINRPTYGSVIIDGIDIEVDPQRARSVVGYVPQDDIVHADLTVREAMRYSARLRLPPDTAGAEIDDRIDRLLRDLEIAHIAGTVIGSAERQGISGGQRKRVNLALELLPRPPLLLLDEPTSGLSSEDASNVFGLLRQLADAGHTIIITTHSPSLPDFRKLDRVIYLSDGELVYFGPAYPDSLQIFPAERGPETAPAPVPDDAGAGLARLTELKRAGVAAAALARQFEQSKHCGHYVAARLARVNVEEARRRAALALQPLAMLRQLTTLTGRFVQLKLRNRGSLPVQLAQAPLVAVLLNIVFARGGGGDPAAQLSYTLFFMAVASIWFGCSNAAREIVGERPILMRERMIGMDVAPYLASKLLVLGALSAIQCLMLLGITAAWRDLAGSLPALFAVLWSCALVGVLMGLTLSAIARSSEAALSATPLLLIPEILLAGMIVSLPDLALIPRWLSNITATRWAYETLLHVEGLSHIVQLSFGDYRVGQTEAAAGLAALGTLYLALLVAAVSGNPRRFA
jgi:ABC-type multidrug transport system ATPase subunit